MRRERWLQVWAFCWSGVVYLLGFGEVGSGVLLRIVAPLLFFWLQPILAARGTRWAGIALVINSGVLAGVLVAVATEAGIAWSTATGAVALLAGPPLWAGIATLKRAR